MLISSNTLPVDTQFTHLLVSGGRATAVRSKIKSRSGSHQRHRNFTSAFGGYFAGNLLASFKNKQDAVVLTTFKKDVDHERVRLETTIPGSESSRKVLPNDINRKARGHVLNRVLLASMRLASHGTAVTLYASVRHYSKCLMSILSS